MPNTSKYTPEARAMQSSAATKDSTHSVAAQASAARLIRYLHQIYPNICEQKNVQNTLVGYLDTVISHLTSLTTSPESKENIALPEVSEIELEHLAKIDTTLRMIYRIAALQTYTRADKLRMFQQMQSIAATCPGIRWDDNHEQWSRNNIYNQTTNHDEVVMASPAETLNLVCAAMFDEARHVSSVAVTSDSAPTTSSSSHTDLPNIDPDPLHDPLHARVLALASVLLALQLEAESHEKEKCSAGRQHDMLFLLNHSFLDEHNKPIELIEDVQSFLMGAISKYLEQTMGTLLEAEQKALMWDWMQWDPAVAAAHSPVVQWLQGFYPSTSQDIDTAWQQACHDFVAAQCALFGLNPRRCPIAGQVAGLPYLTLPLAKDVMGLLITELLRTKTTPLIPVALPINALIASRNHALETFKQTLTFELWHKPEYSNALRDLYTAEHFFQALLHYIRPMTLVGDGDTAFSDARNGLQALLHSYYDNYDLTKRLPTNFELSKITYLAQERLFRNQSHIDIIQDFFAGLDDPDTFTEHWARLQALVTSSGTVNPFVLNDDNVQQWLTHNSAIDAEGQLVTNISSDEVNHILLHAALVAPQQWSPIFNHAFLLVSRWLLQPASADDSASLAGLKQAYPPHFLGNLRLIALVQTSADIDDNTRAIYQTLWQENPADLFHKNTLAYLLSQVYSEQQVAIWIAIADEIPLLLQNFAQVYTLFSLPVQAFTTPQRNVIFAKIAPNLPKLIQNGDQLCAFFDLSLIQLTNEQRTLILAALMPGLRTTLIQNVSQLYWLLYFFMDELTTEQREMILTAITPNLPLMIRTSGQLVSLLTLSEERFTTAQRTAMMHVIILELPILIQNGSQLHALFALTLSQLTTEHRAIIWTAIAPNLPTLVQDGDQLLALFSLSLQQLTAEQRAEIWVTVKDKLSILIQNGKQLCDLFKLSPQQLTKSQRTELWAAVADNLSTSIQNSDQLCELLTLPPETLPASCRTTIWEAYISNSTASIQNGEQLCNVFKLSLEQFTAEQRTVIWATVENNLSTLIQNIKQLSELFKLPLEQFTALQRTAIWEAVVNQLPTWIETGSQLCDFFKLSLEQFTTTQREQMFAAVASNLGTLIQNNYQLLDLLKLSLEQLTALQRETILTAVMASLPQIITKGYSSKSQNLLDLLYSLKPEQLTPARRTDIVAVMEPHLPNLVLENRGFGWLFSLPLEQFTTAQRSTLWETCIVPNLVFLVWDIDVVTELLQLSPEQFTPEQRTTLVKTIAPNLCKIIQYHVYLSKLFAVSVEELTTLLRDILLTAIAPKLPELIQDGSHLKGLFKLSMEQLTTQQRAFIWKTIAPNLKDLIQNDHHLISLFELTLEQFTAEQRAEIWEAVLPKLSSRFRNSTQAFRFLALSLEQFTTEQRTVIWPLLADPLATSTQRNYQLQSLFELSPQQFTAEQRTHLLNTLAPRLPALITSGTQLLNLFKLSMEQLTAAQRATMIEVLAPHLSTFIKNGNELARLFEFSPAQFTAEHRAIVWAAVTPRLPELLQHGMTRYWLDRLSPEQLTETQRAQISAIPEPAYPPAYRLYGDLFSYFRDEVPTRSSGTAQNNQLANADSSTSASVWVPSPP